MLGTLGGALLGLHEVRGGEVLSVHTSVIPRETEKTEKHCHGNYSLLSIFPELSKPPVFFFFFFVF